MERENGMNRAKSLGLILVASAFLAAVTSVAHSQDAPKTSNDVPVLEKSQVDEEDSGDVAGDTVGDKAGDKAAGTGRVKVGKKKPPGGLFGDQTTMLVVMVGGMLLLFFWMGRGKRKQESKRRQMLAGIGGQIARTALRRGYMPDNGFGPAVVFNPRLPGMDIPANDGGVVPSGAAVPTLPDDDDDIAYAPLTHLAG